MKSRTIAGLIAIIAIVAVAVFAGCIEPASPPPTHSTPSLISSPTPTLSPSLASTPTSTPTPSPTPSPTSKKIEKIDTDGDGMSDWFEENIAHLDPNVSNDRYVLWVSAFTDAASRNTLSREEINKFFIHHNKFLPKNVVIIENATINDFKTAVEELAENSDENDLVYVYLRGHGAGPHKELKYTVEKIDKEAGIAIVKIELVECFSDVTEPRMEFAVNTSEKYWEYNMSMTYKEIGETLNKIKCNKMVVGYISCAFDSGVEPLIKNATYPRVVLTPGSILCQQYLKQGYYDKIKENYPSMADLSTYHPFRHSEEEIKETLARINDSMEKGIICYLDKPPAPECHGKWQWIGKYGWIYIPNFLGGYTGYTPAVESEWVKMADTYNISKDFYFGEAKVKDFCSG